MAERKVEKAQAQAADVIRRHQMIPYSDGKGGHLFRAAAPDELAAALAEAGLLGPTNQTPAGGHAPGGGAAGTAAAGVPQREVAPAPPAGQTIQSTVGIRPDCPTCEGPTRETVNMVCPTCGFDYGIATSGACHPDCALGPDADHPGYLGYRCIDEQVNTLPFPGEAYPYEDDLSNPPGGGAS